MAKVTQQVIARAAGVARSTVAHVLGGDESARISSATRRRVFHLARQLGYDFSRLRATRRRARRRVSVDLPARIEVYLHGGASYDKGTARVTNLSTRGALLTDLALARRSLPLEPFQFRVGVLGERLTGICVSAELVHVAMRDQLEFGVRFVSVGRRETRRLEWWLRRREAA